MVKYEVIGQAKDRHTGRYIGKERKEIIDTDNNVIFKGAKSPHAVLLRYESYWNDLNSHSKEVVEVKRVTLKGGNVATRKAHKQVHGEQDFVKKILGKF